MIEIDEKADLDFLFARLQAEQLASRSAVVGGQSRQSRTCPAICCARHTFVVDVTGVRLNLHDLRSFKASPHGDFDD